MTAAEVVKTMAPEQVAYMVAKVLYETAEEDRKNKEKSWLAVHGVKNPDGTVPGALWAYDGPEEDFDRICTAYENDADMTAAAQRADMANIALRAAEDKLIAFGLSIVPENVSSTLRANIRKYDVRRKVIDLAFRLNAATVR